MNVPEDCVNEEDYADVSQVRGPCRCSPRFEIGDADGIRIRLPKKVTARKEGDGLSHDSRLPICITTQFNGLFLRRHSGTPLAQILRIILVDDAHSETYEGALWRDRLYVRPPRPPSSDAELAATTGTNWVNGNIVEYIRLPARSATYRVYVVLDEYKSNVRTVEVTVSK
jgi:hypothetical protein